METTENIETLDVTILEPRMKHSTIFKWFGKLAAGEAFIIYNDHDPKPLYYQMRSERGNTFKWEYLKQGPEVWDVKISKLAEGESETVGALVVKDYRKAQVFKKYGIDFCCGGNKSIKQACVEKGINQEELEHELLKIEASENNRQTECDKWSPSFLADYIVNMHHTFVRETLPVLHEYTSKIAKEHGSSHPELVEVATHFTNIANELEAHMPKEERVLFPYIKQLKEVKKNNVKLDTPIFSSIQNPINMMEMEHEHAGMELGKIRELTNKYTLPSDACATYTVAFKKLKEFEEDLFRHIHLENNVLFPMALELEKEVLQ